MTNHEKSFISSFSHLIFIKKAGMTHRPNMDYLNSLLLCNPHANVEDKIKKKICTILDYDIVLKREAKKRGGDSHMNICV